MLYQILLLHNMAKSECRIKDYLQLSGCGITEVSLDTFILTEEMLQRKDLILLCCDNMEFYFEVVEQIREITQMPIIVLCESDDEWMIIKSFQCGADDYIIYPVKQSELIARVRARIERYRRLSRPFGFIQCRGLLIEINSRKVILNGEEIEMTVKEFDLLLCLAQRPGEVLSKEQLYEMVWKDELADGYYNSVAVQIKKVRRKIEEDMDNPKFIQTVWGIGYRFVS